MDDNHHNGALLQTARTTPWALFFWCFFFAFPTFLHGTSSPGPWPATRNNEELDGGKVIDYKLSIIQRCTSGRI